MADDLIQKLIVAVVGGGLGIFGTLWTARLRESRSARREQLQFFYAPMEILLKMNQRAFDRYMTAETPFDREFIETNIWYPNNLKIKGLVMEQSHHLGCVPGEILDLLEHINVWLAQYELIHVRKEGSGPVFAGPKGKPYPRGCDAFVYAMAGQLRRLLNDR